MNKCLVNVIYCVIGIILVICCLAIGVLLLILGIGVWVGAGLGLVALFPDSVESFKQLSLLFAALSVGTGICLPAVWFMWLHEKMTGADDKGS
jgi:hypothetical protein